jgi:DNA-binding transcriptional MerR regulator
MFRIGDFSRIARVSARLLRFYDEMGLFAPAHADPQTGYRYYTVAQLPDLNRILVLKDLGFELDQVRQILRSEVGPQELRRLLLLRRNDAAQALAAEEERLRRIESRIAQLDAEDAAGFDDVRVRAEPARPHFLALRRTVPSFAQARELIAELRSHARPWLARDPHASLVAIAHSPQFEQDEIDVEFGYALQAAPQGAVAPLRLRELEAVPRMAVCVRAGLPEDAHLVTAKIGRFLAASGEQLAGPGREFFLQPPKADRMQDTVVEMQFPLAPRG